MSQIEDYYDLSRFRPEHIEMLRLADELQAKRTLRHEQRPR